MALCNLTVILFTHSDSLDVCQVEKQFYLMTTDVFLYTCHYHNGRAIKSYSLRVYLTTLQQLTEALLSKKEKGRGYLFLLNKVWIGEGEKKGEAFIS